MTESTTDPATEKRTSVHEDDTTGFAAKLAGWTRFIVVAPIIGLFFSAVVLTAIACVDVVSTTAAIFSAEFELKTTLVAFIELADIFLLAVVLYIMSLGLYELFIDDRLPLPAWLEVHSLEDLKEKLVGVVVVVLAVFFLGSAIESKDALGVLYLGVGIAAIIFSLSYFMGRIQGEKPAE